MRKSPCLNKKKKDGPFTISHTFSCRYLMLAREEKWLFVLIEQIFLRGPLEDLMVSRWAGEQVSRWAGELVSRWAGELVRTGGLHGLPLPLPQSEQPLGRPNHTQNINRIYFSLSIYFDRLVFTDGR